MSEHKCDITGNLCLTDTWNLNNPPDCHCGRLLRSAELTARQSAFREAAEMAEKLHDHYVEKEQFKWPEMRTEAASALGELQSMLEAKAEEV